MLVESSQRDDSSQELLELVNRQLHVIAEIAEIVIDLGFDPNDLLVGLTSS